MSGLPGLCSSQGSVDSCPLALFFLTTVLIETDMIAFNKNVYMRLRINQKPTLEAYGFLSLYWPVFELTFSEKFFKNVVG